jgi:hypothetical protein
MVPLSPLSHSTCPPSLLGEAFDQPAADPRICATRIDPEGQLRAQGSRAPSDDGLMLDSKNTILPEDPVSSPAGLPNVPKLGCAVGNVHYRFGGGEPNLTMCMFWEGEKRCEF